MVTFPVSCIGEQGSATLGFFHKRGFEKMERKGKLAAWKTWGKPVLLFLFLWVSCPLLGLSQEKGTRAPLIKIGVIQTQSSPDFAADQKGFEKALADGGFREGARVIYDRRDAKGDKKIARDIAERFLREKVALIHAVATPASQAVAMVVQTIPVVFSSVTNPVASNIVPSKSLPGSNSGTNVTGVSDRWPVFRQLQMYSRFFPKAKRWGTLYNPGDIQSLPYIEELREATKRLDMELIEGTLSNRSEAASVVYRLASRIQVLTLPFDTTVLHALDIIVKVCNEKKIPLFGGDVRSVVKGAMAAYGFDYFQIGYAAGKKAVRILNGEPPGTIPWEVGDRLMLVVNEKAARAQGAIISPSILKQADKIIR